MSEETPTAPSMEAEPILRRLADAMHTSVESWDDETRALIEPGGVTPLSGTTRDEIVGHLGEPSAPELTTERNAAWAIGQLPEGARSHPPILVVDLDGRGVVTAARFQLAM